MTTSHQTSFSSEVGVNGEIPLHTRAYFRERCRNRLYDFIIGKFLTAEAKDGLTRAELGRRLEKRPEIITRLLGGPGNWTIDTISDLLLGIGAEELEPSSKKIFDQPARNQRCAEWVVRPETTAATVAGAEQIKSVAGTGTIFLISTASSAPEGQYKPTRAIRPMNVTPVRAGV